MKRYNSKFSSIKVILLFVLVSFMSCQKFKIDANEIDYDGYKFTVLSPGLINIRDANTGKGSFNYDMSKPQFTAEENNGVLKIETNKYILFYTKGAKPLAEKVKIEFVKEGKKIEAQISQQDEENLGGIIKSLDRCDGDIEYEQYDLNSPQKPLEIPKGLLSRQGWTVLKNIDGKLQHNDTKGETKELFAFCYGTDYQTVLSDFTRLNGSVPLLPKWTLGNWYSRYQPLSAQDYKDIVERFRTEKIPIDVIVPDMNWHIDGWFGTRYDKEKFPDMKSFFTWAHDNGLHVGFNHHPGGVYRNHPEAKPFIESLGMNYDSLVTVTDSIIAKSTWDGFNNTVFYGESNPKHIKPHFDRFLAPIMNDGLDFHWVDGTPSVENLHEYYSLTEKQNNKRAIVLTRQVAGSFDHHRYPIGFSADTYISWESLKTTIKHTVMGANNGVYWSHDIGGHMERFPEMDHKELFVRWVQSGALSPFNRLHATGGIDWDTKQCHNRKPWEWGNDVLNVVRKFMQLKYRFLPYTYSLNRNAHDNGLLMCHGMYINYPDYNEAYEYAYDQYMYGPFLLVAPISDAAPKRKGIKGKSAKKVWIPEGTWFDYFTGESIMGPKEITVEKSINEIPLFVKAGAIIPQMEFDNDAITSSNYSSQKPMKQLTIEFYQPETEYSSQFKLYEDDGESLEYKNQQYRWTTIAYKFNKKESKIGVKPTQKTLESDVRLRSYQFVIKQIQKTPESIKLNEKTLDKTQWEWANNTLKVVTPEMNVIEEVVLDIIH